MRLPKLTKDPIGTDQFQVGSQAAMLCLVNVALLLSLRIRGLRGNNFCFFGGAIGALFPSL